MDKWQIFWRKVKASHLLVGVVFVSFLGGCAGTNMAQPSPYMLPGAGLGAATGAAVGIAANPGNPWKGAAIGGLLGTVVGGVAGEAYGRSVTPSQPTYQSPPPQAIIRGRLRLAMRLRRPRLIIKGRLRLAMGLGNRTITTHRPLRATECLRQPGRTGDEGAVRPNRDLDDA